jgi:putative ABC transport system substrate-binding protein
MRRREFITLLGGAAATWPLVARAQHSTMPLIGFVDSGSPAAMTANIAAFHRGLSETGYTDGQNLTIDYRWADGQYDRLPPAATRNKSSTARVILLGEVKTLPAWSWT